MDIREYILSGIVESYVLGLASEQERAEFEQLCLRYPELRAARNEFEAKLETKAFGLAIAPPSSVKEKVLAGIREVDTTKAETKIISMDTKPRSNGMLRFVAAAAAILLLISAWFAFDFYSKNQTMEKSMATNQAKLDSMSKQMEVQNKMMEIMTKPGVAVVNMVGTQKQPSSADIYWDSTTHDVYMVVKNMPKLPSDKQYQLWAFINNQPVDLGLFDMDKDKFFLQMKNVENAEAFAITIEQRGNAGPPQGKVETSGKRL